MTARYITVIADGEARGMTWWEVSQQLEGKSFDSMLPIKIATGIGDVPFLPVRGFSLDNDGAMVMEL